MGQDYADQRYYNPTAGRFYTPDPLGLAGVDLTDPTSWNKYAYVNDDPVNRNDPRGLEDVLVGDFGGGGGDWGGGGPWSCDWSDDPSCGGDPCGGTFLLPTVFCFYPGPAAGGGGGGGGLDCGESLHFQSGDRTPTGLLGITSFFEDEAAVAPGNSPNSTILSIWSGIDWTFENRANLSPAQAAAFYGRNNVPTSFMGVVTGPSGSQVWNTGTLKTGFSNQLNAILNGPASAPICNGFGAALGVANGVVGGTIPNPVPGALQFASGGVVPGHGPGVIEQPVANFGNSTFYRPVYPVRRRPL